MRPFARGIFVCLILALLFSSCGPNVIPEAEVQTMQQLGNAFVKQLNGSLIAMKDDPQKLLELDGVVVIDGETSNISKLYEFYEDYKVAADTELVVVFKSSSFVVSKVVFRGSQGYYLRYEYNPFDEKAIDVITQRINKISITKTQETGKVELSLKRENHDDIVMTFRNIVEES